MYVEWKFVSIDEISTKIAMGPFGSDIKTDNFVESGVPVIRGVNLTSGRFYGEGFVFLTEEKADKLINSNAYPGDLVFTHRGTLGQVGLVPDYPFKRYVVSQSQMKLTCNLNIANPVFIYYFFKSQLGQHALLENTSQTGVPAISRPVTSLKAIRLKLPPLIEQKKIAKILGDLDDKIEINTKINQTLEAMAQALFKSWFVDFEPVKAKIQADLQWRAQYADASAGDKADRAQTKDPSCSSEYSEYLRRAAMSVISGKTLQELESFAAEKPQAYAQLAATADLFPESLQDSELGPIPQGWEVKQLGAFLEIKRGGSPRPIKDFIVPSGYPWVKIADATADKSPFLFSTKEFIKEEGLRKTVYLKKDSLILSNSATPGLPKFLQLDACIHDGWLYFPKKTHFTDTYLYFLFLKIRDELVAQGNGSVFTNLKTDILRNQSVVVPSETLMGSFTKNAGDILRSMRVLCEETQSLATTRDTLLPKLLSGEIDLSSFCDREVGE